MSAEDYARNLVTSIAASPHRRQTSKAIDVTDHSAGKPVWERFAERASRVPEGIVHPPKDLAKQVSHYLYGTPKQD